MISITTRVTRLACACALSFAATVHAATPGTVSVKIIGFNDFHGNVEGPSGTISGTAVGGVDYFAAHIARLKAENPHHIVVSAGDLIGASPLTSALFHDEPTIEAMNRLGLDLNAVGNHGFDEGKDELLRMQNGGCHPTDTNTCKGAEAGTPVPFEGADFRFLAANVVDQTTGKTLFAPYRLQSFAGIKVAFIGMTLEGTPSIVTPSGVAGLRFDDEADTVNALIPRLRNLGAEAIVVLLHEGGLQSGAFNACSGISGVIVGIVNRLHPEVDLVVSGHTHQAYNCRIANSGGQLIPVTSAGAFGRFVTDINMTLDRATRDVTAVSAENILIDRSSVTPHAGLTQLVNNYKALAALIAHRLIGSITATITRSANAAGESALGDVIADAQRASTAISGAAQIAFMNPGGIRADLSFPQSGGEGDGNVTYSEAFTVQPFGNSLVTLTLNGAELKTLLEQQFTGCTNNQPFDRILQVSAGFSYTWNPTRLACDKVVPGTLMLNGAAIDPATDYRVTVNSFLADGGDLFTVLPSGRNRLGGAQDIDALEAYFAVNSPVPPGPRNRIARQN